MPEKHQISSLKTYLSSKESLWFWSSLTFIILFFIFSWITSENILILFIKRATTLIFTFLVPGYVIIKAIYPRKNEINVIERFAFSVAFSLTFVMFTGYILNYVWAITRFSLAITTFILCLTFTFTALSRCIHLQSKLVEVDENNRTKATFKNEIMPLVLILALAFIIKSYDSLLSPVLAAADPYDWVRLTRYLINEEHVPHSLPWSRGYPAGFALITSWLTIFLDTNAYEIIRYLHIFSFLNIIPAYLLANYIFKSRDISFLAVVLMFSTKYRFYRTSISNPESLVHFFLILALLMLLKTIEKPNFKNASLASLLLSSTILEYHMPIQLLVPFLIVIFPVNFIFTRLNKNLDLNDRAIIKAAFFIGFSVILLSGLLWYFWQLDFAFEYLKGNKEIFRFMEKQTKPTNINYIIYQLGIFLTIFSLIGSAFILLNKKIKEVRYQFLIIYFIVIYLLFLSPHFGLKRIGATYTLSYLVLPASMLASYGFFNSLNLISKYLPVNFPTFFSQRKAIVIIIVLFLFNYTLFFNYSPNKSTITRDVEFFSKNLDRDGLSKTLFLRHNMRKLFTLNEYLAFKWLGDNTPRNTKVLAWVGREWLHETICERDVVRTSDLQIYPNYSSTDILRKIGTRKKKEMYQWYLLAGFKVKGPSQPYAKGSDFSNATLASIARDPNFKLVYQNPQIKIYYIDLENHAFFFDKAGGFSEDFADFLYWGSDLKEEKVLSTDGDIATYKTLQEDQPIDVDFSTGLDTRPYPYFETRIKINSGKINVGVYDSSGKVNWFLNNFTTNGKWETYKFNLYDWLTKNGYETKIYGIIITNLLDGITSFSSNIDWISIHNHIFWDMFENKSKIAEMDNIRVDNGDVTLSKATVEILSNSGFENGFEGWRPQAKWSIDSEESHSANKSAVLYGTVDPADDPSAYLDTKAYRGILKPNTSYRFSAWVKGNVTDPVSGAIRQLESADPWSEWIYFTQHTKTYDNWTYSEGIITTPGDINGDFYIRIYGGGNPAVWIDDVSLTEDIYVSSGTLISTTTDIENPIISVKPMWTSTEPDGTDITIEISVDNGTTWTRATNGVPINYTANDSNKHLLYRASFRTNDTHHSPILHDITLTYEEQIPTQPPVESIVEEPIEHMGINAELVSDFKLSKYKVKRGEVIEITYAVKNVGPSALEGYLAIDDMKIGDMSIHGQLFTKYPRIPYKIEYGETVSFEQTYTVRQDAPAGRYKIWREMWDENLKTWVAPMNRERGGFKVEMEVV